MRKSVGEAIELILQNQVVIMERLSIVGDYELRAQLIGLSAKTTKWLEENMSDSKGLLL